MGLTKLNKEKDLVESSPESLFFSHVLSQIRHQEFSRKTIRREKRKLIQDRRRIWASLGAESLHSLADQYSQTNQPAKAACAQIACLAHRLITVIPGLILSPIAGALGTLQAKLAASDHRAVRNLKQKFLLRTLYKLNHKVEELKHKYRKSPVLAASQLKGRFILSPKVREDLKAILAYAKTFDLRHHEDLRLQISKFEKFVESVNQSKIKSVPAVKMPLTLIDPYIEEEL